MFLTKGIKMILITGVNGEMGCSLIQKLNKLGIHNIIGLDTGCFWGNKLTAIRLEDKKLFQVKKNENI